MIKKYLQLLILSGIILSVSGKDKKKVGVLPVPAFGYSPETSTYVGAVTLFTFNFYQDSTTRVSNADFEFNYTWNKQVIIESTWNYYFKNESWFTQGKIHFSKYPDNYYGIGAKTPQSQEVLFDSRRSIVDVNLLKHVGRKHFIGMGFRFQDYNNVENTNPSIPYPELSNKSMWGPGILFLKDTRNNILNSTNGSYFLSDLGYYFSEQNYSKLIFDYRNFHTFQKKYTLALRCYNSFTLGTPPFYDYSLLGGDAYARGISYGRFRDKNSSAVQVETRVPLFWKLGLSVFGGATGVYPSFKTLTQGDVKSNFGAGLRFLIDKKENINLRFDYAVGSDGQSGFYVAFGESF